MPNCFIILVTWCHPQFSILELCIPQRQRNSKVKGWTIIKAPKNSKWGKRSYVTKIVKQFGHMTKGKLNFKLSSISLRFGFFVETIINRTSWLAPPYWDSKFSMYSELSHADASVNLPTNINTIWCPYLGRMFCIY